MINNNVILYTDGSYDKRTGISSIGGFAIDETTKEYIFSFSHQLKGNHILDFERIALFTGLVKAKQNGCKNLTCYFDDIKLEKRYANNSYTDTYDLRIKELKKHFKNINFRFVERKYNSIADKIAGLNLSFYKEQMFRNSKDKLENGFNKPFFHDLFYKLSINKTNILESWKELENTPHITKDYIFFYKENDDKSVRQLVYNEDIFGKLQLVDDTTGTDNLTLFLSTLLKDKINDKNISITIGGSGCINKLDSFLKSFAPLTKEQYTSVKLIENKFDNIYMTKKRNLLIKSLIKNHEHFHFNYKSKTQIKIDFFEQLIIHMNNNYKNDDIIDKIDKISNKPMLKADIEEKCIIQINRLKKLKV